MSELPRRPFAPETPPPGGLDGVRHEAARRRRIRAIRLTAGGAATAAAAAVAVAVTGAPGGADTLQPLPPAVQPTPGPAATATLSPPAEPAATPSNLNGDTRPSAEPQPVVTATSGPEDVTNTIGPALSPSAAGPQSSGSDTAADATTGSQPSLRRYQSTSDTPAGAARLCGFGEQGSETDPHASVGWCMAAPAHDVSGGERLVVQVCRDSSTGSSLSYSNSREVNLTVRRGSTVVWDWATQHPGHSDRHQLSVPANGCWNWAVVWPRIDNAGKRVSHGTFTFVARTEAAELQGKPTASTTFDL